jgi:DNA-binding IclR family transcriptional regulator
VETGPATVSRIVQILSKKSFLRQNMKTRKFSLGPSTFELGKTIFRFVNGNLFNISMPFLVDLREEVGETVMLETMSGKNPVVTYIAQGKRSLSVALNIEDRVPVHASPGAKAILAFSDPKIVDSLLNKEMQPLTPYTITDAETLSIQMNEIRIQGVAFTKRKFPLR